MPIMKELRKLAIGSTFFGIILNLVVIMLSVLSIMLISSMLLVSVEGKAFEIGVMRMLGFSKLSIIVLLLTQALVFVIPSLPLAFFASFPLLSFFSQLFASEVGYGFEPVPTLSAIIYSLILGITIPIISSILPIRRAL